MGAVASVEMPTRSPLASSDLESSPGLSCSTAEPPFCADSGEEQMVTRVPAWHTVRAIHGSYYLVTALDPPWAWCPGDLLHVPLRALGLKTPAHSSIKTCELLFCQTMTPEFWGLALRGQLSDMPNSGHSLQSDPCPASRLMRGRDPALDPSPGILRNTSLTAPCGTGLMDRLRTSGRQAQS